MFSSLEDARSDSTELSLTQCQHFFKPMHTGQQPNPDKLAPWPALSRGRRSKCGAVGKTGEVPVIPAILDVISSVSMTNTESIISA